MSLLRSHWNMIVEKGAPINPEKYSLLGLEIAPKQEGTDALSEVIIPELGEQYGDITCERIELTAPIYYGDDAKLLEKGAGQYTGSGLPGQGKPIVIGGHDGTFFAPLEDIQVGDTIIITTSYGSFQYKVTELKTEKKVDSTTLDLIQYKEQLILYTCYPFGQLVGNRSGRYFVYCDRTIEK